ncbi:MAG: hypothetical protein J5564_06375 [Clostridia bacterium]|nr:hypothetical protein [Clostridia bacterium]
MELSKSAQEVITQAQMLRLEGESEQLCQEHILYGLLLMACYLDPPMNGQEYREEAKELRAFLLTKMHCISAPKTKLRLSAKNNDKQLFTDASATIGRAAEIAGDRPITPLDLAKAVHEIPSPVVRAMSAVNLKGMDSKYNDGGSAEEKKPAEKPQPVRVSPISVSKPAAQPAKPAVKPAAQPARPAPQPAKPAQQNNGGSDNEYERIAQAIRQLDKLNTPGKPGKPGKPSKPVKRKRKTKFGLLTYRGGSFAAIVQYFLLALLIPFGVLFALEHFTHCVTAPQTPWIAFGVRVYLLLWGFILIRGITRIIGLAGKALALFLRLLADVAMIALLAWTVVATFYAQGADLSLQGWIPDKFTTLFMHPDYPQWLKYVSGVLGAIVLVVGSILFEALNYTASEKRIKISYGLSSGRPAKVMFQGITRQLILPLAMLVGIWAYPVPFPNWQIKTFWIVGFLFAWNIPNIFFTCMALGAEKGSPRNGEGLFKFLRSFYTFLFVPLLVLFLHWLFGWSPIKLWVLIVLGVYTLLMLIGSIIYAKS